MTLRQRVNAKSPLPPVKRPKWSLRQHVVHSGVDHRRWKSWMRDDVMIDKWVESLLEGNEDRKPYFNSPQLLEDISYILFKYNPTYYDPAGVKPDAWLNRQLLDFISSMGAFEQLRQHTQGEVDATCQGVSAIAEVVSDILEGIENAIEASNQAKQADENGEETDSDSVAGANEQAQEEIEQASHKMGKAMRDLARDLQNQQSSAQNFGNESGQLGKTDPETRQKRRNFLKNQKMQELANRIGRMKRMITGHHTRTTDNHGYDPVGIETGDNLGQVLDDEWLLTMDDASIYDFLSRYTDSRLQQHQTREVIDSGLGDVVCCVDCSGSMGGADKQTWAIAVAESVRQIATRQGRDVKILVFNTEIQFEYDFGYDQNFEKVMEWLSTDSNGGTNLTTPLDKALQYISVDEKSSADILMITDGEYQFDQSWIDTFNAKRQQFGIRNHVVHIDPGGQQRDPDDHVIKQLDAIADNVTSLNDLTDQSGSEITSQVLRL